MTVITVDGVTRRFGDVTALDDVSLDVAPGELVGMLGPNGAGKTTLLSLISGQRRPDVGTVRLLGGDPRDAATRVGLGITPQETGLPPTLRVGEVVDFVGGHFPDPVPTAELLEQFGLTDKTRKQTGSLSGGQKRRLAVALSLVGRPRVVLLDEPTTGLDVTARQALWDAIRQYHAGGGTVLLTSHYLEEVQALAERVVVIDHGVVRADDSLDGILSRVGLRRVSVRTTTDLTSWSGVSRGEHRGDGVQQLYTPDADALVRALVTSGVEFSDLQIRGASLEEAFAEMVADDNPLEGAGR
ncbi:ABC transporter ATP-binding protein [Isoptericola chiayiensis]|uniref:ABC transporter ATP-binding protein n=1 Tax=Isoptericola chiayiensis TaxID=579446 RepID=A0ABP8XZ25_9MICO|nr:ABC transporter ATP-binding protein [Isoptericola chiayiensis]NOW02145.1 ABC-2 type transport system ATP-binding protein [Isoptericola chiayiensis]